MTIHLMEDEVNSEELKDQNVTVLILLIRKVLICAMKDVCLMSYHRINVHSWSGQGS